MHCIVYVSKALSRFNETDLIVLSRRSNETNKRLGITGYLYYDREHFLQYIESDNTQVNALYKSIEADARHQILFSIQQTSCPHRRFPNWGMNIITDSEIKEVNLETILVDTLKLSQVSGEIAESNYRHVWRQVDMIAKYHNSIPTNAC